MRTRRVNWVRLYPISSATIWSLRFCGEVIMPFVIDDKRRKQYIIGIRSWHEDRFELMQVAYAAQERFEKVVALCKLGEYRSKEFQDMYACIEQQL